jgi:hypothetical protein
LAIKFKRLFSPKGLAHIRWRLENLRGLVANGEVEVLRVPLLRRMGHVLVIKKLNQRLSGWNNQRQERDRSLWEGRFKSMPVKDSQRLEKTRLRWCSGRHRRCLPPGT